MLYNLLNVPQFGLEPDWLMQDSIHNQQALQQLWGWSKATGSSVPCADALSRSRRSCSRTLALSDRIVSGRVLGPPETHLTLPPAPEIEWVITADGKATYPLLMTLTWQGHKFTLLKPVPLIKEEGGAQSLGPLESERVGTGLLSLLEKVRRACYPSNSGWY